MFRQHGDRSIASAIVALHAVERRVIDGCHVCSLLSTLVGQAGSVAEVQFPRFFLGVLSPISPRAVMSEVDVAADILTEFSLDDPSIPNDGTSPESPLVTIGATVPTGFEFTAAAEVEEKLGCCCKISKDRGKIYFEISMDGLAQVHRLRSVDNLFVVVQEFSDFPFKDTKEAALEDLKELAAKVNWAKALKTWELNNNLKKKKKRKKTGNLDRERKQQMAPPGEDSAVLRDERADTDKETAVTPAVQEDSSTIDQQVEDGSETPAENLALVASSDDNSGNGGGEVEGDANSVLKFRVTCNRAGDKHSFTSNEAARDFGGAVQEYFQWKADMTKFDVEVLLNISYNEMLVGIALTEESLHRRNITHFGPTTLRSTLAYGMLRLCDLEPSDIIVDPMCGTGAIPIEGVSEWPSCFFIAGDNNRNAVNRTASNITSLLRKQKNSDSAAQGLPIDAAQWDISKLPLRTSSVDVIITDMPFGKRIGSKKKNWDLYPACLREMSRVCRAGTGRAVLLTHDRKCFIKALAREGHLWRKMHTVWVNIGGLHAGVYLLKRTNMDVADPSSERLEENQPLSPDSPAQGE